MLAATFHGKATQQGTEHNRQMSNSETGKDWHPIQQDRQQVLTGSGAKEPVPQQPCTSRPSLSTWLCLLSPLSTDTVIALPTPAVQALRRGDE